ncbi:hypothetical protein PLESTB_000983100 [Pleodorina starrii]|uniref:NADPH:adrenodoxin oxidoreductase, mitochondrial n=1 Tax=Pleodorina starrii TaxID=330485 RepID=A0A9W6BNJ7_9CHLO|nr:hypothetical protein PLESTM_000545800 [Pleodorina starrii]GLC55397.1 hypothetical protein PLESTB_000983100 [Pleodorina starrii]GLC73793.1 hypothetical protein PLESTF_001421800 [Pleodorina starrii]
MMRLAAHHVLALESSIVKATSHNGFITKSLNCLSAAFTTGVNATVPGKLHICVVGSGPAGFYTVDRLLKRYGDAVHISVLDRLPTPFGLVRSGVAPDHQDTKNVINQFGSVAADPRVSFHGNVLVGRDVDVSELRALHHAVVLAYGAESDRRLGIPGEEPSVGSTDGGGGGGGGGVFSAREFVWWYNGHPDAAHLPIDLSKVRSVAICGIGNVALDCARALLAPPARFVPTDMAAHALAQLAGRGGPGFGGGGAAGSSVREVHLVARRGPVQAACTPKELKELLTECGVSARTAAPDQLVVSEADAAEMKATRLKRRVHELVTRAVADAAEAAGAGGAAKGAEEEAARRDLFFQFYRNPVEIRREGPDGAVTGLRVERTVVRPDGPGGASVAVGSGEYDTIECQLVLKSIGYKSLPLQGVAFDSRRGVVVHREGRVLKQASPADTLNSGAAAAANGGGAAPATDLGLYVVGWLKRGPTGIIGTNLVDADETAASLVADTDALVRAAEMTHGSAGPPGLGGLSALLRQRGVRVVDWRRWRMLDEQEVAAGRAMGRVREKVTEVREMLRRAGFEMQ